MKVARTVSEVRSAVKEARQGGARRVGFVPTMGALHAGHYSLIDAARRSCDFLVVSIFVNPTQFGPGEDYEQYPRSWEADRAGCESRGVDVVFAPSVEEMYPEGFATTVHVANLTEGLCGRSRPGHFDGVCTVVSKLFNAVGPDVAFFGAKDYQQAVVIRRMVVDLNMPVEIEVCPTVREADGLALSSRNQRLSPAERAQAPALFQSLCLARDLIARGWRDTAKLIEEISANLRRQAPLGRIDYVEVVHPETLRTIDEIAGPVLVAVAVRFPSARLIDNLLVDPSATTD